MCVDLRYTVNSIPLSENRERGRGQTGTQFSYSFYCGLRTHMSLCVPSPIFISHTHPLSIHARGLSLSLPRAPTSVSLAISGVHNNRWAESVKDGRWWREQEREGDRETRGDGQTEREGGRERKRGREGGKAGVGAGEGGGNGHLAAQTMLLRIEKGLSTSPKEVRWGWASPR